MYAGNYGGHRRSVRPQVALMLWVLLGFYNFVRGF